MRWAVISPQLMLKKVAPSVRFLYFLVALVFSSSSLVFIASNRAQAADFTMQTGYYVGTGVAGLAITGVGFQPDLVIIKSSTAAGAAVFKTSTMPANTIAYMSGTANNTATNITFTSDGFTVGTLANVNSANVVYNWIAFFGSDCTATGNFCVGTYTGNGAGNRNITVGFQPELALVKRSTNADANFRIASQPANETQFMDNTARETTGLWHRSFAATTFQVGATNNTNGATYHYFVFSDTAGSFAQGTYAGNGADNRNIAGVGFVPDFVLIKNSTSGTANNRRPMMNFTESHGDNSSYVGDAIANTANDIQILQTDGFQIGNSARVNENTITFYWFAFSGAPTPTSSGNFSMKTGSYTGTGASNPISGLGFQPDLVIIKASTAQFAVFRTSLMVGDSTAHMASATANFTGGITSISVDGFTVGTAAQTNSNGVSYQWQAFSGAFNPLTNSGSDDFAIGAYYGTSADSRNVQRLPWQPDMVTVKRNGASAGTWRPSSQAGDNSSFFAGTTQSPNFIQAINTDGFQIGTDNSVNANGSNMFWFAFKEGANFAVGTYAGTGAAQSRTDAGFRAEYAWIKRTTNVNGVMKSVSLGNTNSQYFAATADAADRITRFVKGGFRLGGAQTETNAVGGTYHYAAWNDESFGTLTVDIVDANEATVTSPNFTMSNSGYSFDCRAVNGVLGESAQRIRVSNPTTTPGWSLSIAPTDGATALWRNVGDTEQYDVNDPSGSPAGCGDGIDGDTRPGQLSVDPSTGTIAPETGCSTGNVTLGSLSAFNQGVTDSIDISTANGSADSDCIWDITGVDLTQMVPGEQPVGTYDINLTITIIAN